MKTYPAKYLIYFFIFFIIIINIKHNNIEKIKVSNTKEKILWVVESYIFDIEKNKLIEKIYNEISQNLSVKLVIFNHEKNTKATDFWDKKTVVLVFPHNEREALRSNYKTYIYSLSQEYESLIVSNDNSELSFDKINDMIEAKL